jgi:hypothetical protein
VCRKADQFVDVSLNNWLRRLPPEAVMAHLNLDRQPDFEPVSVFASLFHGLPL